MADKASFPSDKSPHSSTQTAEYPYPTISSIPLASSERLAQAAEDAVGTSGHQTPDTVLYLAYGSNMCSKTFLGVRRIRPLSRVNVWVPSLRLTFDLPGMPYHEPCFANVTFRKFPADFKWAEPGDASIEQGPGSEWDNGLVGVVYEVTQEDYRNIMRTEGAGTGYGEIVVPCLPLISQGTKQSSHSETFLARTLYAPRTPCDGDAGQCGWWCRLTTAHFPTDARPSARYLKLLADGAREHGLPDVYQLHLASLRAYGTTGMWHKIGGILFASLWISPMMACVVSTRMLANQRGKAPEWLANWTKVVMNVMWMQYDAIFKPVFGN